ncbi:hypothetical protein L2088_16485 [Pseudomonas protegens]|uniref:hypothetical protein n=1 Tax=Pseudomonas protegens TaxID=380021 RepID=UPI0020252594|nr:hypothetical protein [Pseudomonas protegens]MCL9656302.1 hypothetical protein [Pseudomonas protegens]
MELSERLLKILKNNPSWIGRVYESFIISAIKDFERNNPPAHSPDFKPETNRRPYGYLHNKLFDPVSEDNGESDVADIYFGYPQPLLDSCKVTTDPLNEDKDWFCRTTWNGWAVEVKTKLVDKTERPLRHLAYANELKTALPVSPKAAWMQTRNGKELTSNQLKRRWADLYVYILYQLDDGIPDFTGATGTYIMVIPTFILNEALKDTGENAETIQLNKLMKVLVPHHLRYFTYLTEHIPGKMLHLASEHWQEMFAYKREGDALKRQWYENIHLPSLAKPRKR